jgi:hypothetical protein
VFASRIYHSYTLKIYYADAVRIFDDLFFCFDLLQAHLMGRIVQGNIKRSKEKPRAISFSMLTCIFNFAARHHPLDH